MERVHGIMMILIVLTMFIVSPSFGQVARLHYEEGDWVSYTDFRYINSISVGPQYIYFGTTGGITRYDRYLHRWDTPYTTSDGLSESWIERVFHDPSDQYIWCQTRTGYFNYHHPTEKRWYVSTVPPSGILQEPPQVTYPDFFTDFEYTFLTQGHEASIQDQNLRAFSLRSTVVDNWNTMWIGTWGLNAGVGDLYTQRLKLLRFGLIEPNVSAMAFDGPFIWLTGIGELHGSQGITRYNRKNGNWTYYEARYIDGLGSDNVTSIAADKKYVWFGTYSGLAQLDKKKESWKTYTISDGLSDNEILDLSFDGTILWVGTAFGLSMLDRNTGAIRKVHNENLATAIVYDVEVDAGTVWAATNHGLFSRPKGDTEWVLFADRQDRLGGVVAEIAVSKGTVWFAAIPSWAAEERLFLRTQAYQFSTGKPRVPGKESLPIALFLSTFEKSTGTWEQYFPSGTFSFGTIYDLAVSDSIAWIATDEGVLKFDRGRDRWRRFTVEDGLMHNLVQTILPDGNHVWFGTPEGATRFYWNDPYRID